MGDCQHGTGVRGEMLLQPLHALGVQVVGGLVEQQQVGLAQQQLAQGDPATLTTGEHRDVGVAGRAAQRVHRLFELGVEVPGVGVLDVLLEAAHLPHQLVGVVDRQLLGDLVVPVELDLDLAEPLLDIAEDGLLLGERRLLLEDSDGVARRQKRVAVGRSIEPCHDLQHGRLAGPVRPHDTDLRAGVEHDRDVVEDDLVPVCLAGLTHGVDELRHTRQATCSRLAY
jgi:hypothetical protein